MKNTTYIEKCLEFDSVTYVLTLYYMNWLTHDFWTRTGGWEFDRSHGAGTSSPSHWQQVEEQAPKPVGWMMCFLLMTFVPVQELCVNIYIYIYVYIHICIYALLYEFCFLWFTNCVLLSDDNSLIPGCLWLLVFVLNNTLILDIWCSTIPHLPECFCPWTFYRIQHGAIGLGYSAGSFRLCNWLSLRRLVSWINHLPSACWSTFWKSIFKHQLGCRFDILDSISSFLCILTYATIYVLIHHIIFWLYLYFLNILYFFKHPCTNIFHRRSLCTFYFTKKGTVAYITKKLRFA